MVKTVTGAVNAAIMIAVGGSVFLACENRYVGAVLFSVALLCICYMDYYLFTGKIGYAAKNGTKQYIASLFIGLAVNLAVTYGQGILIRFALPTLGEKAEILCAAKLTQSFLVTFVRAIFCGVLMYAAVALYKEKKTPIGILFCIPVFILSGFEHSVADMFYFGASGIRDANIIVFEAAAVLGNSVGSLIPPILSILGERAERLGRTERKEKP